MWSTEQAIWFGQQIEGIRNDYLEDPVFGLHGMRRVREKVRMPLATNTVVVNFEQLAANVLDTAVDVILLDTTFWGGIRPCVKAAGICETFQLGVAVHSSGELGIQLATMLHMGAVVPNLTFAADAHYHHLTDDVIEGGPLQYEEGAIAVPDRARASACASTARSWPSTTSSSGASAPTRTTRTRCGRAGRPLVPNDRWADPAGRARPGGARREARSAPSRLALAAPARGAGRAGRGRLRAVAALPAARRRPARELPRGCRELVMHGDSPTLRAARDELRPRPARAARRGRAPRRRGEPGRRARGRHAARSSAIAALGLGADLGTVGDEGFVIRSTTVAGQARDGDRGEHRRRRPVRRLPPAAAAADRAAGRRRRPIVEAPRIRHRVLNHWDNLDRTVERGYAGFSLWDWHKLPDYRRPALSPTTRAPTPRSASTARC